MLTTPQDKPAPSQAWRASMGIAEWQVKQETEQQQSD